MESGLTPCQVCRGHRLWKRCGGGAIPRYSKQRHLRSARSIPTSKESRTLPHAKDRNRLAFSARRSSSGGSRSRQLENLEYVAVSATGRSSCSSVARRRPCMKTLAIAVFHKAGIRSFVQKAFLDQGPDLEFLTASMASAFRPSITPATTEKRLWLEIDGSHGAQSS